MKQINFISTILLLLMVAIIFQCKSKVKNSITFHEGVLNREMVDKIFENTKFYPDKTEIAIAVIIGEQVEYLGIRKEKNSVFTIDNRKKIFEIGSISKVFLTSLLVKCLTESLIDLDDPIKDHLPINLAKYSVGGKEVKIIHLANHTSGIKPIPENLIHTYEYEPSEENEIQIVSKYLKNNCDFKFIPGTQYEYSNLGMALLGMIVCDKLGADYESLVKKYITSPLDMPNTVVNMDENQLRNMVVGRHKNGKVAPLIASELYTCTGTLKSTAEDMVNFLKANIKDSSWFALSHKKTFEIDKDYDVALGWHYSKMHKEKVYYHHGGTVGYSTGIAFEKDNDVGLVVLSNISALLQNRPDITKLMYDLFGQIERRIANT